MSIVYKPYIINTDLTGSTSNYSGVSSAITSGIYIPSGFTLNINDFDDNIIYKIDVIDNLINYIVDGVSKYCLDFLIVDNVNIYDNIIQPGYYCIKISYLNDILEDLAIPYESQYRSRIVLHAGEYNQPLLYGFIGNSVTFLMIKVTYDSENDPYYQYEQEKYNIEYYFENDNVIKPLNRLLIMTGSVDSRIPQIYLNNPLDYDVTLDVLHATVDTEYETEVTGYQPHYRITNVSNDYTGITYDQYIRCSATTSYSYSVYLPIATGSGNILVIKNFNQQGMLILRPQGEQTIDYGYGSIPIPPNVTYKLVDGAPENWDMINN